MGRRILSPLLDLCRYNPETGVVWLQDYPYAIRQDSAGYLVLWKDGKPVAACHRIAAQLAGYDIGGLDVHHINGDKTDNRAVNLVAISHALHGRLHSAERDVQTLSKRVSRWISHFRGHAHLLDAVYSDLLRSMIRDDWKRRRHQQAFLRRIRDEVEACRIGGSGFLMRSIEAVRPSSHFCDD